MIPAAFQNAVLAAVVWSISPILEKSVLGRADPLACLVFRTVGVAAGGLFLLPFLADLRGQAAAIGWGGAAMLAAAGALASILGQVFMYNAIKKADVSLVSPIAGSWPLLTMFLGWLLFQEAMTPRKAAGGLLVVIGVWLLRF